MKPKLNDYFYRISGGVKSLHKINFISDSINDAFRVFEWGILDKTHCGWGHISELKPNPDKKSKVKWIKNED